MNFEHTESRRMLADSLNRFISEQYPMELRNSVAYGADGYSRKLYEQFAELGAIGALFPEHAGGLGGEGFDISVVFECLGRGLVTEPLLGALVVGQAILLAGTGNQRNHLEALISGTTVAALAHEELGGHYELSRVATTARQIEAGWVLHGAKTMVSFGDCAELLLVSARTEGNMLDSNGISLFLVPGDARGITRKGFGRVEGGRVAEVELHQVEVGRDALLGELGHGTKLLERISGYAILALCAEAIGAMDVAKEQTLEYLRTRKQFGAPIGSFQALQHRMVDMLIEIEQARSAVINAAAAIEDPSWTRRDKSLSAVKYTIGRAGAQVAEESIQMHGGIGMTWELPLSHYAKRLILIDHQFGDEDHHLERYIRINEASSRD